MLLPGSHCAAGTEATFSLRSDTAKAARRVSSFPA
jgi:hypothetical protein